jgi:hypothetical protein
MLKKYQHQPPQNRVSTWGPFEAGERREPARGRRRTSATGVLSAPGVGRAEEAVGKVGAAGVRETAPGPARQVRGEDQRAHHRGRHGGGRDGRQSRLERQSSLVAGGIGGRAGGTGVRACPRLMHAGTADGRRGPSSVQHMLCRALRRARIRTCTRRLSSS